MPVRRIVSHPEVKTNAGKVAFQRGPIVFCLEGPDNDGEVLSLVIPDDAKLKAEYRPDLLNGVVVLTGKAQTAKRTLDGKSVRRAARLVHRDSVLRLGASRPGTDDGLAGPRAAGRPPAAGRHA